MTNVHQISVMISEDEIMHKVGEVGYRITEDYGGKTVKLICILKGSVFFACDLAKRINIPVKMDFMEVSSYGNGTESSGNVEIVKDLDEGIEGEHVIVVEDIVDSGQTLAKIVAMLRERNPEDIAVCTLLDKSERRQAQVDIKYSCFNIPDVYVVGYGLDYEQKYRNLPFIGAIRIEQK